MNTFIALLRGINVGGKNILPMKELVSLLTEMGLSKVKTYIQSGNVVFQSEIEDAAALSKAIVAKIEKGYGFDVSVIVLSIQSLQKAMASNPFPEGEQDPKTLHLFFLSEPLTDPDIANIETIKKDSEQFQLTDQVFYLYAPDGIGRSKLAANVEKALGVVTTARNWRSTNKILSMAEVISNF